ncbi:MAG: ABC transporter substrate-binding protein [Clostridiales bacterium]|nr:ABC transporter substrate-binding protein [Clostridiales bacterium]
MQGSKWRKLASKCVILLIIVMLLVPAGCANKKPAETATANTSTTTADTSASSNTDKISAAQLANPEVRIGILVPYTGELGANGNYWFTGAKVAAEEINAAGGVLGKQIKLFTEDDQSNVEQAIRGAQKLIKVNNCIALHGMESSAQIATYPLCKESQVFNSNPGGGSTRIDNLATDYLFRTCPSDNFDGVATGKMLIDGGYKTLAILYENDESRLSISETVAKEFERQGGKVITKVAYAPNQNSYVSELKKVFATKPDVFYLAGGQESAPTIIKEWRERDYGSQLFICPELCVPDVIKNIGGKMLEGVLSEIPVADNSTPQAKRFAEIWQKVMGVPSSGVFEANSYDGIVIIALAMEIAGEATGKAISDHYKDTSDPNGVKVYTFAEGVAEIKKGNKINYEGASGSCDFNKYGNVRGAYTEFQVKNGKWEQIKFYPESVFAHVPF